MNVLFQGMVLQWSLGETQIWTDDGERCLQHSDVTGGWLKWVHLAGTSWTFHHVPCSLLPPAPSSWGLFPGMQGWQTGTCLFCGVWGHRRGHICALQGCEVQALLGEEETAL